MKQILKKYKKTVITITSLISLVLLYTLGGFFGVPWLLKSAVPHFLSDKNISLSIQEVKFNPYKFELNTTKVELKTYAPIFSVNQIDLKLAFRDIFSKNINITTLKLVNPHVNIQREANSTFNFESLISAEKDKKESENSGSGFNFLLNSLEIINGGARYSDESLKKPFLAELKNINYTIKGINLKEHNAGKHRLDTNSTILQGLDWNGGINLNPLKIYGKLSITGLKIDQIWQSYLSDMPIKVKNGDLDLWLNYALVVDKSRVSIGLKDSNLTSTSLLVQDENNTISMEKFQIPLLNFSADFGDKSSASFILTRATADSFRLNSELGFDLLDINEFYLKFDKNATINSRGGFKNITTKNLELNSTTMAKIDNLVLDKFGFKFQKNGEILGANFELNRVFLRDLNAQTKDNKIKFNEFNLTNLALFSDDFNTSANASFTSANMSSTSANLPTINASFKNLALSDLNSSLDTKTKDLNLRLNLASLKDFNATSSEFGIKNNELNLLNLAFKGSENFTKLGVKIPQIELNFPKFEGFGYSVGLDKFYTNDLSVDTNGSNLSARLIEFGSTPILVEALKRKFIQSGNLNGKELIYSGNFLNLKELKLLKTAVFSQDKNFAGVGEVGVKDIKFDILKTALDIGDINILAPNFTSNLTKDGFSALNSLKLPKSNQAKTSSDTNFKMRVKNILVTDGKTDITEPFSGKNLRHEIILKEGKVLNFGTDFTKEFLIKAKLNSSDKISATVDGSVTLNPLNAEFDIKTDAKELSKLSPYMSEFVKARVASGTLNYSGKIKMDKDLKIFGGVKLDNFAINDENETKIIGVKNAVLKSFSFQTDELKIDGLALDEPFLKMSIDSQKNLNLLQILKNHDKEEKKDEKKSNFSPFIKNFSIKNGLLDFSDHSLFLPFDIKIAKLNTTLDKIEKSKQSDLSMYGVVGNGGSANITLKTMPFEPKKNSLILMRFKDINLPEITPYSATFVGYEIKDGTLDMSLDYTIADSKMVGKNSVKIDTIKLGNKVSSKQALDLPISMAISILEDANHVIHIDLPVEGDLSNPQFSYGGIVWQAVTQLFTDVVTSPFRLMGGILGLGSGEELSGVNFIAGLSGMMDSQEKKIKDLKKITDLKPEIKLTITPAYDPNADKYAIQKQTLESQIALMMNKDGDSYDGACEKLRFKYFGNAKPANLYEALIKEQKFSPDILNDLAKKRAKNLKEAMEDGGIDSKRVEILDKIVSVKASMDLYVVLPMGITKM